MERSEVTKVRLLLFSLALTLSVGVGRVAAQETTSGSLAGRVVDPQNAAVPGAAVTLAFAQGSRSLLTDGSGRFFVPFLTPGTYSVKVEMSGFVPVQQKGIEVRLGKRLELSFTLQIGDVREVVEVPGASPVVDTGSTTTGGNLLTDDLKRLPVGRTLSETLYLVPGVGDSSGAGRANPSIGGATGLDNVYVVDGVNITDEGFGGIGTFSRWFGSLGSGVTTDFIQETQVKTGGFEAEYGMATGGVVNVVTYSGTNAVRGSVFGYLRPQAIESGYKQLHTPNGTVNRQGTRAADFGFSMGGPLVRDRVFLFGVFNPQFTRETFTAPQGFPLASLGSVDRKRHSYSYAGKLTYQLSPKHRVEVSTFGDPSHGENGPQRVQSLAGSDTEAFSAIDYGGHNQVLRYDGIPSSKWLLEAAVSHSQNAFAEIPSANTNLVTDGTVVPVRTTGGVGNYQNTKSHRYDFQLKSTNSFEAAGTHQVRYGVDYERMEFDVTGHYSGPTFTLPDGTPTVSGARVLIVPDDTYGRIYSVQFAYIQNVHDTHQSYFSAFLQDAWRIGRLTLHPGVRYEQQSLTGDPPLCHADDSRPGAADGTGPLVPCRFEFDKNFAPRIGVLYDVAGNGRSKLYGSFSRYYVRIPNDLAARSLSADSMVYLADYFDAGLTQPVPDGVSAAGRDHHYIFSSAPAIIDPKAKLTYEQEFLAGLELAVGRAVHVGVRYVHRTIPRALEDTAPVPAVAYYLGVVPNNFSYEITNVGPGNPEVPELPGLPPGIQQEGPVHKYDAIEVTANKTFSNHWSLLASYRWSKLRGNFEGFFRSDNGQPDPAITSLFDFPIDDPSYTSIGGPEFGFKGDIRYQGCVLGCGALPNDRTHQLKLYGNYTFRSLNLALGLNAGSGRPLTGLFANPVYGSVVDIPDNVRGSGIQTATDGFRTRTKFEFVVDVRVDYTFKIAKQQRLILSADVFNLLNSQNPTAYDAFHDTAFGVANPNFGQPVNGGAAVLPSYQTPRQVRLGVRFDW
jgi:hypothetical protein